jgi:hypothetical protein
MTAFDTRDLEIDPDFKAARFDRLLQKPIRFSELRQIINEELKSKSSTLTSSLISKKSLVYYSI